MDPIYSVKFSTDNDFLEIFQSFEILEKNNFLLNSKFHTIVKNFPIVKSTKSEKSNFRKKYFFNKRPRKSYNLSSIYVSYQLLA